MHAQALIGDLVLPASAKMNAANSDSEVMPQSAGDRDVDSVVTAAMLVTCAFRLRDEAGLIAALRALTEAVETLEARA